MPYKISFSDPTKFDTITVPDMPPGINTVDTSLSLVGRGYPNYGQKIAENFVHLLENFASPIPPQNPIEGQLWYDTSDPNNKVLRIMDGAADATRWPSANGIYQQGNDPRFSATQGLKIGDIWVDTSNNQLKIFNSNDWTTVGPSVAGPEPTGAEPARILDTTNTERYVILNKVGGKVVAIVAYEQFTPKAVIDGFTILKPGINLTTAEAFQQPVPIFNGTAFSAQNLTNDDGTYPTADFLRKNDQSQYGQIVDGVVRFRTPSRDNPLLGQGRDGIVINNVTSLGDPGYVQFYKGNKDAIILNNDTNGKIVFKVKGNTLATVLELGTDQLTLAGNAAISKAVTIGENLTVSSTNSNAVSVIGGAVVGGSLTISNNISVSGTSTFVGEMTFSSDILPSNNGTQNIGSLTKKVRQVYAEILGSTGSVFIGTFDGLARGLLYSSQFKVEGQITGTTVTFNGTGTSATFVTQLMPSAIADQTLITTSSSELNLLVLNTSSNSLNQISRDNFLSDVFPAGMIMPYGVTTTSTLPTGWLLCDGASYAPASYVRLYNLIGFSYGASGPDFKVPNMTTSTFVTTGTNTGTYISYIIKT